MRCASFLVVSLVRATSTRFYFLISQSHDRVNASEQQQRERQRNMQQQPTMQPMMHPYLTAQLPLFLTNFFQLAGDVLSIAGQHGAQAIKNPRRVGPAAQRQVAQRLVQQKGPQLPGVE